MASGDVFQVLEPERRHRGQHPTLARDGLGHHDVERGDAIGRDHQQPAVAGVVDVAHLAGVQMIERHEATVPAAGALQLLYVRPAEPVAAVEHERCPRDRARSKSS